MTTPSETPDGALSGPDQLLGRVVVVIPTYNERDNVEDLVGQVLAAQPRADVMIVDDGSPDGTGELADAMAAADSRITVIHRTDKAGLGAAYVHGYTVALERDYDVMVQMDCDGSHQPHQIQDLLAAVAAGSDLAIGSRWVSGGSVVNWPWRREALSRGGNLYVRLLLGMGVNDATAGFRAYTRAALKAIDVESVQSTGYVFQTDMTWRARQSGMTITEVPIEFIERVRGESKMDGAVATESLRRITRWGLAERRAQVRRFFRRLLRRRPDHTHGK